VRNFEAQEKELAMKIVIAIKKKVTCLMLEDREVFVLENIFYNNSRLF